MQISEVNPHAKVRSDDGRIERERGAELIEALLEAASLLVAFGAHSFPLESNSDLKVQRGARGIGVYGREPVLEDGFSGFEVADRKCDVVRAREALAAMTAILRVGLAIGFDGQGLVALSLPLYARLIGFMCFGSEGSPDLGAAAWLARHG